MPLRTFWLGILAGIYLSFSVSTAFSVVLLLAAQLRMPLINPMLGREPGHMLWGAACQRSSRTTQGCKS